MILIENKNNFLGEFEYPVKYSRWETYWGADVLNGWLRIQIGPKLLMKYMSVDRMAPFDPNYSNTLFCYVLQDVDGKGRNYKWWFTSDNIESARGGLVSLIKYLKYKHSDDYDVRKI